MSAPAPAFDVAVAWGIGTIACLVAAAWVWLFGRGQHTLTLRLGAVALFVLVLSSVMAASGLLSRIDLVPPPPVLLIAAVLAGAFGLGLSRFGQASAREIPLVALVAFQSFRLPLELVMHRAATLGIMPEELTWSGYNFDIVTGAGALALSLAMARGVAVPRALVWAWNIFGCMCLVAITAIAIATAPMLRLFGDPPHVNTWVLFWPYVWLPVVLVTAAVFGHIVITRALASGRAD